MAKQCEEEYALELLSALPDFHAFTRCDFTASFLKKGKVRPLDMMVKNSKLVECFSRLGDHENLDDAMNSGMEEFVCTLYGRRKFTSVNKARRDIFDEKFDVKLREDLTHILAHVKGINPSSVLFHHAKLF